MRYFIKLALLLLPLSLGAQTVTITGTVQDGNGAPYQNGTVRAVLVSGNGSGQQAWTFGGTNPVPSPQCIGGLDGFGKFTCPVTNTSLIDQQTALPQWQFQFNSFNYPVGGTRSCTVPSLSLSSNQDITTQIAAVPCPIVTSSNIDLSSPPPIGNVTPNTGQFTNINTTVMVTCPSCTDWGAALQLSYNSCPTNTAGYKSCLLVLPRVDNGPWLATFTNNSPSVCVQGQGETTTTFAYTGSGDAIRWNISPFVVTAACSISDLSIAGTASGRSGIHVGDIISASILRVVITDFTAGTGLWQDNINGWTERYHWDDVDLRNNLYGWRLSMQGSNPLQQSHGYGHADLSLNVNAGQTGIRSENAVYIYNGHFWTRGNGTGAITAWIDAEGTSNWDQNEFHIRGEDTTTTNGIKIANGAHFRWYGDRNTPGMVTDTNGNGATYGGTFRNLAFISGNSSDAGIAANYAGSGIAGSYYPVAVGGFDNPFGYYLVSGSNLASAGVVLFDSAGNAFAIQKLAFGAAPSTATTVATIDKDGVVTLNRWNVDANFFGMLNGTNPVIAFNPNTYLAYDRTNHLYQFYDGLSTVNLSIFQTGKVALSGTGSLWFGTNQVIDSSLNVHAASVIIGGTNTAPVVATPTVGQAACIYAAGPPVQIGKCTTVVSSSGACTCSP